MNGKAAEKQGGIPEGIEKALDAWQAELIFPRFCVHPDRSVRDEKAERKTQFLPHG